MKVCLVTDFAKTGGAATAADRIARTFFENGCKVDRISSDGCSDSPFTEHVLDVSRKLQILSKLSNHSSVSHFMPNLRKRDLTKQYNSSSDISPTGGQMPRLLGLAMASKLYRTGKFNPN